MAKDKTTIRFWLRTDRKNKDLTAPIHVVYQIQGQRKYYSVPDTNILEVNWNAKDQVALYIDIKKAKTLQKKEIFDLKFLLTASDVTDINKKLSKIADDIDDIETRFKLDQIAFSPKMVIDRLNEIKKPETKKDKPGIHITAFIEQYVNDSKGTRTEGSLKVYKGLKKHLEGFELQHKTRITFESIDLSIMRAFNGYLNEEVTKINKDGKEVTAPRMNNVTAAKQVSTLKTLLNYARIIYKIPVNQDYRDYKISRRDSEFEVITLTQEEFLAIYNHDFSDNKRLDAVRDVFCFSCATGLRYSDLAQLRREHIRKDNTLRMTASKTSQKLVIPLNPVSYSILQKYSELHIPLPVISNQKTNEYLKEIGKIVGIDTPIEKIRMAGVKKTTKVYKKYELISIHVGRKSFITLSLEKGIAIQEVMSLSGHTTFKAFRRYVDVNDKRKKTVMGEAWGKVDDNKLKAI